MPNQDEIIVFFPLAGEAIGVSPEEYERLKDVSPEIVERHHGPGPHPGTGTEQTVHAGGRGAGFRWEREGRVFTDKQEAMEYVADQIRDDPYESAFVFSDAGLVLEQSQENPMQVAYNKQDQFALIELKGKPEHTNLVSIHNHPDHINGVDAPPSFGDFDFALQFDIPEFWVVTPNGRYELKAGEMRNDPWGFSSGATYSVEDKWNEWTHENWSRYLPTRMESKLATGLFSFATKSRENSEIYQRMRVDLIEDVVEEQGYYDMEFIPNE